MEKENALKILRELHDKVLFSERTALETFIPELKESEDERIRERLIEFFKDWGKTRSHCWSISISDILAWLEKQGENKSNPCDGCVNHKGCIDCENGELRETEQKPAWSEEDEVYLNTTIAYLKDAQEFKKTAENCINWLKSLKQRIAP